MQSQTLPVVTGPVISEATSVMTRLHATHYPPNNLSSTSSWKASVTAAVIPPAVPILPPPVVIAPIDTTGIQGTDPLRGSLPQLAATSGRVEAPAVAMTTESCQRISRAITGRGCRDQLPAVTAADNMVSSLFIYF